jgi:hypothetical protein
MTVKQAVLDRVRMMNKLVTNRILIHIAGTRFGHFAVLTHTGRKSGKPYRIPIIAEPVKNGFVIALTYGKNADYPLRNPEFVGRETALEAFPVLFRAGLRAAGIEYFLRLSA